MSTERQTATEGDDAVLRATLAFLDAFPVTPPPERCENHAVASPLQQRGYGDQEHDASLTLPIDHEPRAHPHVLVDESTLQSLVGNASGGTGIAPDTGHAPLLPSSPSQPLVGCGVDATSTMQVPEPKKKKKPRSWNPNKARNERKDEILYLRKKASELEVQLDDIKRRRPETGSSIESSHSLQDVSVIVERGMQHRKAEIHPAILGVWKGIVSRQNVARTQAERENVRLKLVLEQQLKLAKSLEKMLRHKSSTQVSRLPEIACRDVFHDRERFYSLHSLSATKHADAEIFDDLISGLDQSYAQVDSVFQGNGLASRETELSDARMRFDASSGMCLEIFANKVLPFGMHAVANAAWQHFIFGKQRTPSRFYDYIFSSHTGATDDTIVENFNMELHAKNTSGYFRVKQVFRRYVEETRIVIVSRSIFFPVQVAGVAMTDVCFRSTVYVVVKRPLKTTMEMQPELDCSLLQTSYNYTSLVGDDHPKVGVVTDFMLRATEANIRARHQMIENVLLLSNSQSKSGFLPGDGFDGCRTYNLLDETTKEGSLWNCVNPSNVDLATHCVVESAVLAATLAFVDAFESPRNDEEHASPVDAAAQQPRRSSDATAERTEEELMVELLLPLEDEEVWTPDDGVEAADAGASRESYSLRDEAVLSTSPVSSEQSFVSPSTELHSQPHQPQQPALHLAPKSALTQKKKKRSLSWNPNRARDERRDELVYLRGKVVELNAKLNEMRAKTQRRLDEEASSLLPVPEDQEREYLTEEESILHMSSAFTHPGEKILRLQQQPQPEPEQQHPTLRGVWREIAIRQNRERERAERENIRLKLVLEDQLKIAKSWEKLLQRKATTQEMEKLIVGKRRHHKYPPTADRTDAEIFEDLLTGIDKAYANMEAVFTANGLANLEGAYNDARIRSDRSRGIMYLEICSSRVLPFDVHSTGTAAWNHFVYGRQKVPARYYDFTFTKNVDVTEDTFVESFNLELHAKSTAAHLRVKKAMRRILQHIVDDTVQILGRHKQAAQTPMAAADEGQDAAARDGFYVALALADEILASAPIDGESAELLLPLKDEADSLSGLSAASAHENGTLVWSERASAAETAREPQPSTQSPPAHPKQEQVPQETRGKVVATTASTAKKKRVRTWNPNRARDERRNEMIYLRKRVDELTRQLNEIINADERNKKIKTDDGSASTELACYNLSTEEESMLRMSSALSQPTEHALATRRKPGEPHPDVKYVWRDIATRQKQARMHAERENVRLRLVLEDQLKIAKSWEKMLHRKQATHVMENFIRGNRRHPEYLQIPEHTEAEIFEDLLTGIDSSYAELDAAFVANGLDKIEDVYSDARIRTDRSTGTIYLEICSSKVLPFDIHSTGTAAWNHFVFGRQRVPSRFYDFDLFAKTVDVAEDTIVESFSLELHAKSTAAHLCVRKAMRRFVEEDRIVIVFRTIFYPVELAEEPMSGMCFLVTGYIVIKRPKTIRGNYSLLQMCSKYTPTLGTDHPKAGVMTELLLRTAEANFATSHQLIENVLLEQAMKKESDKDKVEEEANFH
ncbi:hypothetical protein FI667_g11253, partial [Globisporangium splendens]